jgi:hypothetical protein
MSLNEPHNVKAMTAIERFRFIRSLMVAVGVTNAQIARAENVRPEYIYYVLKGLRTGYRIRRAISKAVKQPVQSLWPDTPERQLKAPIPP